MHPVLFRIGDFYIGTYGVLSVLALVAALTVGLALGRRAGLPADPIYDLAFIALVSGFLGARLLFILVNFPAFLADPLSMILSRTGFVFLGGLALAAAACGVYVRWKALPMWDVGDVAGPSLALAHAIGRVGCFFAGCCYGAPTGSSLGVAFTRLLDRQGQTIFSFAYQDHLQRGLIGPEATASLPVLPTQLFESAANLLVFALLLLLWRRRSVPGHIFAVYLLLYGAARFALEFLRGDLERGLWFGGRLSTSQLLSLALIVVGAWLWNHLRPSLVVRRPRAAHGK